MIVKFSTRAGALTMHGDAAVALLRSMGHSGTVPGAILAADLPAADLATYAARVGADVLALSVLMSENMPKLLEEIGRLAQLLPAQVELWGGGNALYRADAGQLPARLKLIEDLRAFEREITLLDARVTH